METSKLPETRNDLNDLKRTAVNATRDIGSTASTHAVKAKGQASDLVRHLQEEAPTELCKTGESTYYILKSGLKYVSARPVSSLVAVVGVGLLIGWLTRSTGSRD